VTWGGVVSLLPDDAVLPVADSQSIALDDPNPSEADQGSAG